MKTYLNIFIGLLSLAVFESCNDKKTATVTTTTTTVTKEKCNSGDSTAITAVGDTHNNTAITAVGDTHNNASGSASTQTSKQKSTTLNNGSRGSATENSTTSAKPKKNLDGYSAPDGTDAENHDGDEYTKNDKRVMPSGSIK